MPRKPLTTVLYAPILLISLVTSPFGARGATFSYDIAGTLGDGTGTFKGHFAYRGGDGVDPDYCEAAFYGRYCFWQLQGWNLTISGGEYDGVRLAGSIDDAWFVYNAYYQWLAGGQEVQRLFLASDFGDTLALDFAGTFTDFRVASAFETLTGVGWYMPGSYGARAWALTSDIGDKPDGAVDLTGVLTPTAVSEPGTLALLGLGLAGLGLNRRRNVA